MKEETRDTSNTQTHFTTTCAMLPHSPAPKLVITKQTALAEERYSKNGIQKAVYVVVKNTGFFIELALTGLMLDNRVLDFNQLTVAATLLYDCDTLKEVDYIKVKPLEYTTTINGPLSLTVEGKIKVLTSQHEDMFFRVQLRVVDQLTKEEFPSLVALSAPIKVISKPDQIQKKPVSRKRTLNDSFVDTLNLMYQQQQDHQKMIQKLYELNHQLITDTAQMKTALCAIANRPNEPTFEQSLSSCLASFGSVPAEERGEKNKKVPQK